MDLAVGAEDPQIFPERRREKIVRSEDMPKFYEAVRGRNNAVARDLLLLILFSGLRVTEASSLKWEDVDLPLRVIRVKAGSTKADRKLDLPMSDAVRDMLIARRFVGDAKFVFPGEKGHIRGARSQLDAIARVKTPPVFLSSAAADGVSFRSSVTAATKVPELA